MRTFADFQPLTDEERATLARALAAFRESGTIPCTGCRYCMPCPAGVDIPGNLALHNMVKSGAAERAAVKKEYDGRPDGVKAGKCVFCHACVRKCPQKLQIPILMRETKRLFEEG